MAMGMIRHLPKPWWRMPSVAATFVAWLIAFVIAPAPWSCCLLLKGEVISFVASIAGMLFLFVTLGLAVSNSALGILLNARNVYSLSRLQMVLWTVLILSALMSVVACRTWGGHMALAISIPNDLLAAMGISYISAAAAPALLSLKSQNVATDQQVAAAAGRLGETIAPSGQVIGRPADAPPTLADLVKGDEMANAGTIDLSKVQQLLITLMLVIVYAGMLGKLFAGTALLETPTVLPDFDDSFVNLMLVSHGGYLAYKAASKPSTDAAIGSQRPLPPDRNGGLPA